MVPAQAQAPEGAMPAPERLPRRRAGMGPVRAVGLNLLSLAVFLALWQIGAAIFKSPFFPGPVEIAKAFYNLVLSGDTQGISLWTHSWASLYRVLVGFVAGVALGVPLGLLMGLYRDFYAATRAVVEPFRFIPPIAWIPLSIIFFSGLTRFAFLIFIGAFFPVFTSTLVGVQRVELVHRKVALVYGASKLYVLTHIVLPTVMPDVLAGMRVAMGAAWLTIVAAELAGGTNEGLGRMMLNYAELLKIPEIVVGMVLVGAIGFVLNEMLLLAEKWLFKWRWEVTL
jgi:NitT/TauT family transport system permease protein